MKKPSCLKSQTSWLHTPNPLKCSQNLMLQYKSKSTNMLLSVAMYCTVHILLPIYNMIPYMRILFERAILVYNRVPTHARFSLTRHWKKRYILFLTHTLEYNLKRKKATRGLHGSTQTFSKYEKAILSEKSRTSWFHITFTVHSNVLFCFYTEA